MSFFFGSGSSSKPQYTGLQTQTSSSALCIPICWGQNRLAPNIMWQGDFQAHKQKQGKGGGKSVTTYTYSASFQLGLCWGEIEGVKAIWKDQSKISAETTPSIVTKGKSGGGWAFFLGTTPQLPWGYLTTAHPDQALGYSGIAHADIANYDLGQSNTLGQHSFEVQALRWDTGLGGAADVYDADPTLIIEDFLDDDSFGLGFDMSVISNLYSTSDATTTGDSAFQTYCRAMSFALSPCLTAQNPAGETLERWAELCNTALVWNGYSLKFHPYGPDEVVANGVTYIPDFPVRYSLTDSDFLYEGSDPITFNRVDPADAYNSLSLIIANRENDYNELPVPWRDQGLVDQYGLRKADNYEAKEVTRISMAEIVVALIGQRKAYVRNDFEFSLPLKYCRLEPMDVVVVTDPVLGSFPLLLKEVEETDNDDLRVLAEEYNASISRPTSNLGQSVTNTPKNTAVEPGPVNPPIIFEAPSLLTGGTPEVWVGLSGGDGATADPNWGGAVVWLSTDDVHYIQVGQVNEVSRMGKLSANLAAYGGANPDTVNTLEVDLSMSGGELDSEASADDAAAGQNACYVDGEFVSFEVPTMTSSFNYDLDDLYRGLYGSTAGAHLANSEFVFLDDALFKYALPADYIGKTLYLKFQSINLFDVSPEDLSTVDAYVFTPSGASYGTGSDGKPSQTTGVAGVAGTLNSSVSWTSNVANDNVTGYDIYRATGSSQPFVSAAKIATAPATATNYVDSAVLADQAYTYFVVATNAVGDAPESTSVNVTPTQASYPQPFGFAFSREDPVVSKPIAFFDSPVAWSIKSGLPNSQGTIGESSTSSASAPSATTDFDIQSPPGTSIGTMRVASGSLTATFIAASDVSIPLGQTMAIIAPSNLNGLQGTIYGSIKGER